MVQPIATIPPQLSRDASLHDVVANYQYPRVLFANIYQAMQNAGQEHGPMRVRISVSGLGAMPDFRIENADASFKQTYDGVTFKPLHEAGSVEHNWSTHASAIVEVIEVIQAQIDLKRVVNRPYSRR